MLEQIKRLRAERGKLIAQARDILTKASDEQRELSAEESAQWDKLHVDIEAKRVEYERLEKQLDTEASLRERRALIAGDHNLTPDEVQQREVSAQQAVRRWLAGVETNEDVSELRACGALRGNSLHVERALSPLAPDIDERRFGLRADFYQRAAEFEQRAGSQVVGTTTLGGHTVANAAMQALEDALLWFNAMRRTRATVLRTPTGASLPIPTSNDTSNVGVILAESTQETTVTDITFGQVVLGAFKYSSDIVKASIEFVQDSILNVDAFIFGKLGERIARIQNQHFTKGPGSTSGPLGLMYAAALGKTTASASAIAWTELVDLMHSVDVAYRDNAEWMFNDSTLAAFKKLTGLQNGASSDNRPVWVPGLASREPDTILGKPYVVNNYMDAIGAGKHSVVFGDFSKYHIRDVMDIQIHRFVEKYMDYGQYGYIGFARADGDLVDAGTNPVKYLRHPAS